MSEYGSSEATQGRCIVRLHGKGGSGASPFVDNGVLNVLPNGNGTGWSGRQWLYFPEDRYQQARAIVAEAIDASGCDTVILNGFSNGGSFAAKLYSRGETFGGRLIRVVVDDPVPDRGVLDCRPDPGVDLVLYWTGALATTARPGWKCRKADWTCEGGVTVGIEAYARSLGVEIRPSRFRDHVWYVDAPELGDWSRGSRGHARADGSTP